MFIPDEEKDDRKGALRRLMAMMGKGALDGIKSPRMEPDGQQSALGDMEEEEDVNAEVDLANGGMDMPSLGDDDNEADSGLPGEDEKAMIAELYKKYCM